MPISYINLNNLNANFLKLRNMAGAKKIIIVVKANAYGHGICEIASALPGADAFAVARLKDAMLLRKSGISQKIILLTGIYTAPDFIDAAKNNIDVVVHDSTHLNLLHELDHNVKLNVWLKVDTGMHRLGFHPDEVEAAFKKLQSCAAVSELRLLSHFASSEDIDSADNQQQISAFTQLPELERSFANSAALINFPDLDADWVRIGLLLYGVILTPSLATRVAGFKPVMTLKAPIIAIKQLQQGDKVGYGGVYSCDKDMLVAVVAIGYGDGYPREISADAYCLLREHKCPIIGRVSMDLLTIKLPFEAALGDEVEFWGENLDVTKVAEWAGTIAYTLLTRVNASVDRQLTS